jgi:hypothetical protein
MYAGDPSLSTARMMMEGARSIGERASQRRSYCRLGETDIYDPRSELHKRYKIGVTSKGGYHSIDPGKLTLAPYSAEQCAERIALFASVHS